jgi:predicted esterase
MRRLGAEVTMRLYPEMGHTINEEEIARVREMMDGLLGR